MMPKLLLVSLYTAVTTCAHENTLANSLCETAPKAKKRKTEQPEEVDDEEEVEGAAEDEVDGKELEDEEDAGEDDGDEDVSFNDTPIIQLNTILTTQFYRPKTLRRMVAPRLQPRQPRAKTSPRKQVLVRSKRPSRPLSSHVTG